MKVRITINPKRRTVKVQPPEDPARENLEGLAELAILGSGFMERITNGQAINVDEVRRYNVLCYQHLGTQQDGGEFCKEKAPEEETAQPVKTFEFGEAIRRVKGGTRVARKGWNGKDQYIQLACNISYMTKGGDIVNPTHTNIGNSAIAFVGTRGTQIGWLASQADMLADDWYEVENGWLKES